MALPADAPRIAAIELPASVDSGLVRAIGLRGATLIVIGNVIGSAIFLTSGIMLGALQSIPALLGAWVCGGLLAVAGGLTYAEMGAMFPRTGGLNVFLEEAYGKVWGFMFGWAGLLVILTGATAAVAVGFAEYLSYFVPALSTTRVIATVGPWTITAGGVVAATSILATGWVNLVGVSRANAAQSALTVIKVAGLAAIPVLAFVLHPVDPQLTPVVPPVERPVAAFGVAMIAVLFAYDGWYYLAFSSGEVRDAARVVPRALILGTAALTGIYVLVNVGYVLALSMPEMAGETRVAEKAMAALMGDNGARFIAATVVVSTFGCNIAGTLGMSRSCFALAADGLFFRRVAAIHPRYHTPHVAIAVTCAWAALLAVSGSYDQLFTYVTFASVFFSMLGGLAVFRLRRARPDAPRPYRVWGYPWTPALFIAGSGLVVLNTLLERPVESLLGLGLVALGLPAYWYWSRQQLS
jgi:basic amino acid/polyamine antiporter, APA family